MRRARLLILLSILLIIGSVGITYTVQKGLQERQAPAPPRELPANVTAQASGWRWAHAVGSFTKIEVIAKDFRQIAEPSRFELRNVELRIFDEKKKDRFDQVTSALAHFDTGTGVLLSDGDVEITMGLPSGASAKPEQQLLRINSSGVTFDSKAGKVSTERVATFHLGKSEGQATGAEYDSVARELRLHKDVVLNWKGAQPNAQPMRVTTGSLVYKETESKVYMTPWAKLVRGAFTLEGADTVVTLADGNIQLVEAQKAHGTDKQPKRDLQYAADQLKAVFAPGGEIESVAGENNARLVASGPAAVTTVVARRVDMDFDTKAGSQLKKAVATGDTTVESKPVEQSKTPTPDTRILRSETVEMNMRAGGEEIETVQTHSPGTLEFVPNRAGSRHRTLTGDRMWITYAPQNIIQNFRAVKVTTRTEREAPKGKPAPPAAITSSQDMEAVFDAKGQLATLNQWTDFKYEEGTRRGRAERASLDEAKDQITLTGKARIWDPTGSTDADRILIDQKGDTMSASGNVSSTRMEEQKKDPKQKSSVGAGMLSGPDPVHARAANMTTSERNSKIRYQGSAVLWQGPNRITAETIEIDRANSRLDARGNVATQLLDRRSEKPEAKETGKAPAKPKSAPLFTTVRAPELTYTDKDRLAYYRNGVTLQRPGLTVTSRELRAWMTPDEPGKESTLDKAFADGSAKIVQQAPDRTRTFTGEHAEYYLADEHMVITGGHPQLVDSLKGNTRGQKLTWFARNDRLLVESGESEPGVTDIRKK